MTPRAHAAVLAASLLLPGALAVAQPQPAPSGSKVDAQSLMQSGVKLLEAKDYLGALVVFKDAYKRFPSPKILLNIGTTLNLLDRKAEAANAYQRYLDAPDADPAKKPDVTAALAELDRAVGTLEIAIVPADAEVQIDDGAWQPAASARVYRVAAGPFTVRARKDGFNQEARSSTIAGGAKTSVSLSLTPSAVAITTGGATSGGAELGAGSTGALRRDDIDDQRVTAGGTARRSRFGATAVAHLDVTHPGAAGLVGVTADATPALQVELSAIIGPSFGVYPGARFALLTGNLRPVLAAGMPMFFEGGTRVGVRGAGGVELQLTRNLSLIGELGVELMFNPGEVRGLDILRTAFIPAIGATARL